MRFEGVLGEHEPDPRLELLEQARRMPVPVIGLVPQPHLEDWGAIGVASGTRDEVLESCEVSLGYTLWRNPDDPDDPVNLAELDEPQRRALEEEPPWPRPQWLVGQVQRMRYPMLWECVRTRWSQEPGGAGTVEALLVAHVNHVLVNQFQDAPPVDERCVEPRIPVVVDGTPRDGFRIDTDPHVYGVATALGARTVLTAVVPRDALPYVRVVFESRAV
ncbi:hypothetical protein ACFO1B_16315 [Dactylosporangium siamense]|uniref:Uncharacterized protein n=1 Tax=Dactylosporangium siamense TaxID=685454 RepID=A0A919PIG3_9ACTN|nr:hypothetical protein [Dactylosporangium siamense]GIG45406.1 hypothetical protein Dsi01nite_034470 [Dactylosporangium siamense]